MIGRPAAAAFVLALAAAAGKEQPLRIGLVEEASVELTLVDVEVTDDHGRPVRGLTKADFAVTLNGKAWPVYSVDDLCACGETSAVAVVTEVPNAGGAPFGPEPRAARRPADAPSRFVLYFDFSQLQSDGRSRAVEEAKRWLRQSLRPNDEVSIETYGTDAGLDEPCPFTSDRRKLAQAIDALQNDPKRIEAWPSFLPKRMCECGMYDGVCTQNPKRDQSALVRARDVCPIYTVDESFHGRRSLAALRAFLDTLGPTPGRKAVLYFTQNGALQPGGLYGQPIEKGGDNTELLEDVASTATASRASLYPVFTGNELDPDAAALTAAAVNLGANLADATGGRYNRGLIDLRNLMDATARAGCCLYRIGLHPPTGSSRAIYQVHVAVRGKDVPWLYRVRFENETDRWLKRAREVLRNPAGAQDLPVGAALVPVLAANGRWTLSVQVSLDADGVAYLPTSDGREAQWQVGALLHREGNDEAWEMLGVSRIDRAGVTHPGAVVVHRREIADLRPGRYRLAAFVRDENTSLFGGAASVIDLPPPGSDRIVGPLILRSPRKFFMAALPALAGKAMTRSSVSEVLEDVVPAREGPLTTGDALVVETWLCPGAKRANGSAPIRFVARNGVPQFRFEAAEPTPAGRCLLFIDAIDATRLVAGSYAYHFRWNGPSGKDPREAEAKFVISPAP